jgi:hypothetical protein
MLNGGVVGGSLDPENHVVVSSLCKLATADVRLRRVPNERGHIAKVVRLDVIGCTLPSIAVENVVNTCKRGGLS